MVQTLTISRRETYLKAALFIAANIALPHIFHLFPGGGRMFLPIYFFTLIGTMRYGWQLGLITAVMSPVLGNVLFGVPATFLLPDMLFKGAMLTVAAALLVNKYGASLLVSLASVLAAWCAVGLIEWPFTGAAYAFQDFVTGVPGLAMLVLGSWIINRYFK